MSVLMVPITLLESGMPDALENTFRTVFTPAIMRQVGFARVSLLRPHDDRTWYLFIKFDTEQHRALWVSSDDHDYAWPRLINNCEVGTPVFFDEIIL